jgi:hypothetical protein
MDNFRVGGMPTPPLDAGFSPEDTARTAGSAPTRRAEKSGGLSNAAVTDHVGGNDPAGPNGADWLDAPGPTQEIDMGALMVTLHQAGVALRTAMHEAQQVARDAQVAAIKSEAQDIRNSAGFSFAAAVVAGAFQIAGGALDVGGSFHAYKTAFPGEEIPKETEDLGKPGTRSGNVSKELASDTDIEMQPMDGKFEEIQGQKANTLKEPNSSEENEAAKSSDKPKEKTPEQSDKEALRKLKKAQEDINFTKNSQKAEILLKRYTGLGQVMGGLGQIISGGLQFGSRQQDATEKDDEAGAAKAGAQVEDAANLLKNIDDLISGVRQSFSQMIEAKNQAMNKITQA